MHAQEDDIAKYKGKYDAGYDAIRAARVGQAEAARPDRSAVAAGAAAGGEWDEVPDRECELRCMEVYAAMIDRMDQGIGRIVAELQAAPASSTTR